MKRGLISQLRWTKPGSAPQRLGEEFARPPEPPPRSSTGQCLELYGIPEVPLERPTPAQTACYLLRAAAEIEHGLLVQYLYSLYSISPPPVPPNWASTLRGVALQEMDHLATVQSMLLALKINNFETYFDRANFPIPKEHEAFYPYPFRLEPFTAESLTKYVSVESPMPGSVQDPTLRAELEAVIQRAEAASGMQTFGHVGNLYAYLYWLFLPSDDYTGPWPNFPTDWFGRHRPGYHLTTDDYVADSTRLDQIQLNFSEVQANDGNAPNYPHNDTGNHRFVFEVKEADDFLRAVAQIAIQGEGTEMAMDSHFLEFLAIYRQVVMFTPPAGGGIHRAVPTDPHLRPDPNSSDGLIQNKVTRLWARLCNTRYLMLLQELPLAMTLNRLDSGENARRKALINAAIQAEMKSGLLYFGTRLVSLPRGTNPAEVAGLPFELPVEALPTTTESRWKMLVWLIAITKNLLSQLRALTGSDRPTHNDENQFRFLETTDQAILQIVPTEFRSPSTPGAAMAALPLHSYADVQAMLSTFVAASGIDLTGSPHGTFWMGDYDSFTTGDVPGVPGVKILIKGDAAHSNLVQILKGPITIVGRNFEQMPAGGPFLPAEMIDALADWINRGCPK
jgi:hypothetical protein